MLVDYDSTGNQDILISSVLSDIPLRVADKVKYYPIKRKGIGYARHYGTIRATGRYITCFDADSIFVQDNAIEMMIAMLAYKKARIIQCRVEQIDGTITQIYKKQIEADIRNIFPMWTDERGLTFSLADYKTVGGFDDVESEEGRRLVTKFMDKFGVASIKHMVEIVIKTSSRRFLNNNYDVAFRDQRRLKVE